MRGYFLLVAAMGCSGPWGNAPPTGAHERGNVERTGVFEGTLPSPASSLASDPAYRADDAAVTIPGSLLSSGNALWEFRTGSGVCGWRVRSDSLAEQWCTEWSDFESMSGLLEGLAAAPEFLVAAIWIEDSEDVLMAMDATTGALAWTASVPDIWAAPLIVEDRVFQGSRFDGGVRAFDLGSGDLLWHKSPGPDAFLDPAWNGTHVILLGTEGTLVALSPDTGKKVWELPTGLGALSRVAVLDQSIIVAGKGGGGSQVMRITEGVEDWSASHEDTFQDLVVYEDRVIVTTLQGGVAYDPATGDEIDSAELRMHAVDAADDDWLWARSSEAPYLWAVDRRDLSTQVPLDGLEGWRPRAVGDGWAIVRDFDDSVTDQSGIDAGWRDLGLVLGP